MHWDLFVGQGKARAGGGGGGCYGWSEERIRVVVERIENSVAGATVAHVHDVKTGLHAGGEERELWLVLP